MNRIENFLLSRLERSSLRCILFHIERSLNTSLKGEIDDKELSSDVEMETCHDIPHSVRVHSQPVYFRNDITCEPSPTFVLKLRKRYFGLNETFFPLVADLWLNEA